MLSPHQQLANVGTSGDHGGTSGEQGEQQGGAELANVGVHRGGAGGDEHGALANVGRGGGGAPDRDRNVGGPDPMRDRRAGAGDDEADDAAAVRKRRRGGVQAVFQSASPDDLAPGETSVTFFKPPELVRHSPFGARKFRVDFDGQRDIALSTPATFVFRVPRSFDLLTDAYLKVQLPPIWSPVYPPVSLGGAGPAEKWTPWAPYEFRWIDGVGAHILSEVRISCAGYDLACFSGDYLACVAARDYDAQRFAAFQELTGDLPELNDPANAFGRANTYPSAFRVAAAHEAGTQPSILGRQLSIPLAAWFAHSSQGAFPLVCLANNYELVISVTLRPVQEWFRVRDVEDPGNLFPHVAPDFNRAPFQMHRFLQTPPQADVSLPYPNTVNLWDADVHLEVGGAFLGAFERDQLARSNPRYCVKDVVVYRRDNVAGTNNDRLAGGGGMVAAWMWHFRRSDVQFRNEWANHSNWAYANRLPANVQLAPVIVQDAPSLSNRGPARNRDGSNTGIFLSGDVSDVNRRGILRSAAVRFDNDYREDTFPAAAWNHVTRYAGSRNVRDDGLYCYNFALRPDAEAPQPSGEFDSNSRKNIQLEVALFPPPRDLAGSTFAVTCDANGNPISATAPPSGIYQYTYNMTVYEERYNFIQFADGKVGPMLQR